MTNSDVVRVPPPARRSTFVRRLLDAGARVISVIDAVRGEPRARAVRSAAERFARDGALVFADVDGWPRPPSIHGFIPAVYALFDDAEVLLSVDDPPEGDAEPASRRDLAFRTWAEAAPNREYEPIVVRGRRRVAGGSAGT